MSSSSHDFFASDEELGDTLESVDETEEIQKSSFLTKKRIIIGASSVATALVIAVGSFVGGLMIGGADSGPQKVDKIRSSNSVLTQLESLKDSQIASLNDQLARVTPDQGASGTNASGTESFDKDLAVYLGTIKDDQKVIDDFLTQAMSVKGTASTNEIQLTLDAVKGWTDSTIGDANLHAMLSGASAAKSVGEDGRKGAASTMYVADIDGQERTYLVVTPFVTEKAVHNQLSMMSVKGGKITQYAFVGMIDSEKPQDLMNALTGFVEAEPVAEGS